MNIFLTAAWPIRLALFAVLLGGLTALLVGLGFAVERRFSSRRIFAKAPRRGQRLRELQNTILFQVLAAVAFTVFVGADVITWTSGWTAGLVTFAACWLGFEVYYYGMHRAMHEFGLHRFHREHHESHICSPLTAFSMSVPEGLGWMMGYVLVPVTMELTGLHVSLLGWLAFVVYNYWVNIIGHVNVEVLHANTFHALHYARYAGNYGFGIAFLDRLFGSAWYDWPALQRRVLAGEALVGDGRFKP